VIIKWKLEFPHKISKQVKQLNERGIEAFQLLLADLKIKGPSAGGEWSHYGKLHSRKNEDKRHCHLNKGNPTYVCCWKVNKLEKSIEVYYVGTHENAPY
jgi:hypothetical protein